MLIENRKSTLFRKMEMVRTKKKKKKKNGNGNFAQILGLTRFPYSFQSRNWLTNKIQSGERFLLPNEP